MANRPTQKAPLRSGPAPTDASCAAALDVVPQAIVVCDADGVPVRINRRARRVLGLADGTAPADWPGRLPARAGAPEGWTLLPVAGGEPEPFWLWSHPLPVTDDGAAHVLHAIWPCRVNEEQAHAAGGDDAGFDEMMAVLVRHALLGEMGGALAHQMTQPLNVIRLTAERAALEAERQAVRGEGDQALADRFARLADQAETVFETVALVQGAPAVSGPGDLQPVDLGSVMNRAAHLARGPLRAAGLRPEVITPPDLPMALAEPILLLQVAFAVLTVLAEAVGDAMAEASAQAHAQGRRPRSSSSSASLMVRLDRTAAPGRLIVDMAHERIFAEETALIPLAPDLSLSRRVVLAAMALAGLGGHLMMLLDDRGTLCGVRLDLAATPGTGAPGGDGPDATRGGLADAPESAGRPAILLVEQAFEVGAEIAEFLRDMGYAVSVADTLPTALAALDEGPHDVLVLDLSLGPDAARRLMRAAEAAHPDLAIILVSGDGGGTDAGDKPAPPGLLDMADATLPKPYRLADLGAAVERVLGIGG